MKKMQRFLRTGFVLLRQRRAQTADDIKKIENYLNGIKTMEARFVQTASNGNTRQKENSISKNQTKSA